MGEPFEPLGVVLFQLSFNVTASSAADFNRFIEQVEQELRRHIECPRFFGSRMTTMLPPPGSDPRRRRWFVIVLQSRDHSVRLFIEASTIYLRGYQNERGDVFEFKPNNTNNNANVKPYLTSPSGCSSQRRQPTQLSFSCNYIDIGRSTKKKGPGGSDIDTGVTIETADYRQSQLQHAVVELAEGRNPPGESQHATAQSLLRVIVWLCESIRFRSVRQEMTNLWTDDERRIRNLSPHCLGQINNWDCIGRNLVDSHRYAHLFLWSQANNTGVGNAAEAQEIVALLKFHIRPTDPDKDNPPRWQGDDSRGRRGGGGGSAGGAWGVLADEVAVQPRLYYTMPEEPVMEILRVVCTSQAAGIYGRITVTDGFDAQTIYQRSRDNYQSPSDDDSGDVMMLELDAQKRAIPAYDCVDIDVELYDGTPAYDIVDIDVDLYDSVDMDVYRAAGLMSWNSCDFESNRYDVATQWDIGDGVALEYIVYSRAVQVAVSVMLDNGGARGRGWFTTRNTMIEETAPRRRPMCAGIGGDQYLLRGDHVTAVPIGFELEVTVGFEHEGSPEPVQQTFKLEPSEEGGITTKTDKLQDGATAKVNLVWNLLRKEPPGPGQTTGTQDPTNVKDEL